MAPYNYKRLATGISEYIWKVNNNSVGSYYLIVSDPRDGEVIIQVAWCGEDISDDEKKAILNVHLHAFYKGARHGAEKKMAEIKEALGIE